MLLRGTCFDATADVSVMQVKDLEQMTHFQIA